MIKALVLALVIALFAAACGGGGGDSEPTLSATRPDAPAAPAPGPTPDAATAPAPDAPAAPTPTTVAPIQQTTEPTVPATAPPPPAGAPPPPPPEERIDVPLPDEMSNPELTVLPEEQLPPPPPPLPPPVQVPTWQPVNVLIANADYRERVPVYDSPNGTRLSFTDGDLWSYTANGNSQVLRVTQGAQGDEWVQVEVPLRPNGVRGWVRTDRFQWTSVAHHIHIDLSDRSVVMYEGDTLVATTRAIVGKPATPTPVATGFITEKLPNHSQEYGSVVYGNWVLGLSFYSEVLNTFGGGLPRISLHGTHIPERVGEALSNGCIRIPNEVVDLIARVAPLGTPVSVSV